MSPWRHRIAVFERVAIVLLLVVTALRTFSYPYFPDNSLDLGADDGYPYYARHLDTTRTLLPEYRRLPGYPLFLVASKHLTGVYYSKAGYYVQGALSLFVILMLVRPFRRVFGSLVTILLLALLASPNLWIRLSVFAFPDFLTALLFGTLALVGFHWLAGPCVRNDLRDGTVIALIVAAMILLKAGNSILVVLFAAGLIAARAITARRRRPVWPVAARACALIALTLLFQALIVSICGSGSLVFYRNAMHARIATYLPPAGDNEWERTVERAKAAIAASEGQRMEDENFTNTLAVVQPAIEEVWWPRLRARPLMYAGIMLDEVRRKHYQLAASFTPFMADLTPNHPRIPRKEDTTASRVYRSTGFYLPGLGEGLQPTAGALTDGMFRTVLFWAPLVAGLAILRRRWPFQVTALLLSLAAYLGTLAFGIFIDGRYALPFAPLLYVAQASGFAAFVTSLDPRAGAGPRRETVPSISTVLEKQ